MCAERRGPQPGLETLAGGREPVFGKWGDGWEGDLQLSTMPLPKSSKAAAPSNPGLNSAESCGSVEGGELALSLNDSNPFCEELRAREACPLQSWRKAASSLRKVMNEGK